MNNNDTTAMMIATDRAARYGVRETNPIWMSSVTLENLDPNQTYDIPLSDPDLIRIDRLRLLTDPGYPFYDISYVYGTMRDGRHVRVSLGVHELPKRGLKRELVRIAKEAGRYAKGLGLLDDMVISTLE